jgi:hypothetical protein
MSSMSVLTWIFLWLISVFLATTSDSFYPFLTPHQHISPRATNDNLLLWSNLMTFIQFYLFSINLNQKTFHLHSGIVWHPKKTHTKTFVFSCYRSLPPPKVFFFWMQTKMAWLMHVVTLTLFQRGLSQLCILLPNSKFCRFEI